MKSNLSFLVVASLIVGIIISGAVWAESPIDTKAKTPLVEKPKDKNAWKKDPVERMKRIDSDGDTIMTRAEFDAWATRKKFKPSGADKLFGKWDVNADGQVTLEEFKATYKK